MIYSTVSNITQRAYNPITTQRGFFLRCNHERLRIKWVERKRIRLEKNLTRIREDIRDDVLNNACSPLITPWVMPRPPCPMIPTPVTAGLTLTTPTAVLQT